MKGIILAGGKGTRLYPITISVSKQLQPVYDKPMIYYPLSMLMLAGIQEILIISSPDALPMFKTLFGDGRQWGLKFAFAEQAEPRGLADAFIVGREFIGDDTVSLILGDNIFYGHDLPRLLARAMAATSGATVFVYHVNDPGRYGVADFDRHGKVRSLEEKPKQPKSSYAVTGLYFYDREAARLARRLTPSARGELEITDLNRLYLERGALSVEVMGRGYAWMDAGTHESLHQSASFVQAVQERQGLMISCPDEIAYRMGFIDGAQLRRQADLLGGNSYREYLLRLLDEDLPA